MDHVVADADTLFGATTCGLLIHLDFQGSIRLHWSPLILDALSRAPVDTGCKPNHESARRHERRMRDALPQAEIPTQRVLVQFATVEPAMRSAKDVHVAACAATILADGFYPGTQVASLVTKNIRDFVVRRLEALGIQVQRPDAFLPALFRRDSLSIASAFANLRATLRSAPEPDHLAKRLAADGQNLTAATWHDAWRQGAVHLWRHPFPRDPRDLCSKPASRHWRCTAAGPHPVHRVPLQVLAAACKRRLRSVASGRPGQAHNQS